ncbi:MAG: hypothetical protein ABI477_14455 [Chryseolinea sp.]
MENTPKKKIVSLMLALMVTGSAVFATGIDHPSSVSGVAVIKNGTTFKLYYKATEQSNVRVSILDSDRKVVYTETIQHVDGFVRPYNIASLSNGEYTVEVADRSGVQTQKLSVAKESSEKLAHVFKVSGEDGKYLLTVSNKESRDLNVKIYDDANNMIYNQVETAGADFARIYNLKKYAGKFTFEVTDSTGKSKSIRN